MRRSACLPTSSSLHSLLVLDMHTDVDSVQTLDACRSLVSQLCSAGWRVRAQVLASLLVTDS